MLGNLLALISLLYTSSTSTNNNVTTELITEIVETTTAISDFVPEEEKRGLFAKIIISLSFSFLSITGVLGNTLVIYTIANDPAVQVKTQLSNLPILNLAYTDLLTTSVVCTLGAIFVFWDEYIGGRFICLIWSMANLLGFITTIGLLGVISFDRFIAVTWSLHYPQWVTYNRMFAACAWVWGSCFICCCGWVYIAFDYDFWSGFCDIVWLSVGPDSGNAFIYGVSCTLWFFVTPSATILVANSLIIYNSREKGRVGKLEPGEKKSDKKAESKTNSKVLKAMIIVIASYFILTFPSGSVKVSKVLGGPDGPSKYLPGWVTTVVGLLQLLASCVNPLIYGLFRKDFRESYARTWKRMCGK